MNIIIKILTFLKRNIHIFILLLSKNKSMNLFTDSFLVKSFLFIKSLNLPDKLIFFKKYITFWKYFRLLIKIIVYINLILTLILIYMFTDFDQVGLYGFLSSSLAGMYLYNDSLIINFIKNIISNIYKYLSYIINFEGIEKLRTEILNKIFNKSIPESPNKLDSIPNYNPADNINPPNEFNYKKYLLLGAASGIIIYLSYHYLDWDNVIRAWNWTYNLLTSYFISWSFNRVTSPFLGIYNKLYDLFFNGNIDSDGPDGTDGKIDNKGKGKSPIDSDDNDININDNRTCRPKPTIQEPIKPNLIDFVNDPVKSVPPIDGLSQRDASRRDDHTYPPLPLNKKIPVFDLQNSVNLSDVIKNQQITEYYIRLGNGKLMYFNVAKQASNLEVKYDESPIPTPRVSTSTLPEINDPFT